MKIAHIHLTNGYDEVCSHTINALMNCQNRSGHECSLFVAHKVGSDSRVIQILQPSAAWQEQVLDMKTANGLQHIYSPDLISLIQHSQLKQADIVHVHVIGNYLSYSLLPFLAAKPMLWTLYDGSAFSAGCRHTVQCQNWKQKQCSECPLDKESNQKIDRQLLHHIKSHIYQITNFSLACSSHYLKEQVYKSNLRSHNVHYVRQGVDLDNFRLGDRMQARNLLGLPQDKSIILLFASSLSDEYHLVNALKKINKDYSANNLQKDLYLISIGNKARLTCKGYNLVHRDIDIVPSAEIMATYYQAADVFVYLNPLDEPGIPIMEAAACGTPTVLFDLGGAKELIVQEKTGYLVQYADYAELSKGVFSFLTQPDAGKLRKLIRQKAEAEFNIQQTVEVYNNLYSKIVALQPDSVLPASNIQVAQVQDNKVFAKDETVQTIIQKMGVISKVQQVLQRGGTNVGEVLAQLYKSYPNERQRERGMAIDAFCLHLLQHLDWQTDSSSLWSIIKHWLVYRKLPVRCGHFTDTEKLLNLAFAKTIRNILTEYFLHNPISAIERLSPKEQTMVINFWRTLFLNDFSVLALDVEKEAIPTKAARQEDKNWYPYYIIQSMYAPYADKSVEIDVEQLLVSRLPIALKVILLFWLVNTPYYCGDRENLQCVLKHAEQLCNAAVRHPQQIGRGFFNGIVEVLTVNLWQASYLGGNNIKQLTAYGRFLQNQMTRFYPEFCNLKFNIVPKKPEERIRIGYISSNFCRQAVSYYMLNRFLYRNTEKFEIVTFLLEKRWDDITDTIKAHSDTFISFKEQELGDIPVIAQKIIDEKLDVLIYTDIGMDQVTYKLAAMRLAPVQCVLVGHGVTTGLTTIDYYVSGDFEPKDADTHYTEKLIRLPNLGATQYPPEMPNTTANRAMFNIPENAIVLISCANGIKHGPERDRLLIKILQQVPNSVIVLKPFMTPAHIDHHLINRLSEAANVGGVAGRLIVIPPLKKSADLMSMLALSDIQLDTYPYGGWTTNMEALYAGLPLVTQEGDMARNRWGAAMLRALGIETGIAKNDEEYVEWAVRLAKDQELHRKTKQHICDNVRNVLFNGQAAQLSYEQFLIDITLKKK